MREVESGAKHRPRTKKDELLEAAVHRFAEYCHKGANADFAISPAKKQILEVLYAARSIIALAAPNYKVAGRITTV